ncbi:MAG TPA: hypothetical protein VK638_20535 [Edaphobacter sp.]|nr:hypothetical protein [Edaphobacter sp.]
MLFTAENGSTPGAQIAVVSKTGSDNLHGSLFEYLRNDIFDARQPIDLLNPHKPAFRLNQFGGSAAAPSCATKNFFYFAYEGLRQTLGQTLPGLVPRRRAGITAYLLHAFGQRSQIRLQSRQRLHHGSE